MNLWRNLMLTRLVRSCWQSALPSREISRMELRVLPEESRRLLMRRQMSWREQLRRQHREQQQQ